MNVKSVITVDIKGSTKFDASRRSRIQESVLDLINDIEVNFSDDLFTIGMTGGDEFQVVLNSPEETINLFKFVSERMPVQFRFGVGIGGVEVVGDALSPSEMYGSAFYSSRKALNKAKGKQVQILFNTGDEKLNFELNTIIQLVLFIRVNWTKRKKEILRFVERHEEMMQKEVAEHFGISEQAVSKTINRSGFKLVKQGERLIQRLLTSIGSNLSE